MAPPRTDRRCSVPECGKPHLARGYCSAHYSAARADGSLALVLPRRTDDLCAKCRERKHMARGYYCRPCASEYERERRKGDAEAINARQRARYTPERRLRQRCKNYGLTRQRYDEILAAQDGRCAVCRDVLIQVHIDHDHACCPESLRSCGNCVRGFLCSSCNNGLGRFRDDPALLRAAAEYLVAATSRPLSDFTDSRGHRVVPDHRIEAMRRVAGATR